MYASIGRRVTSGASAHTPWACVYHSPKYRCWSCIEKASRRKNTSFRIALDPQHCRWPRRQNHRTTTRDGQSKPGERRVLSTRNLIQPVKQKRQPALLRGLAHKTSRSTGRNSGNSSPRRLVKTLSNSSRLFGLMRSSSSQDMTRAAKSLCRTSCDANQKRKVVLPVPTSELRTNELVGGKTRSK